MERDRRGGNVSPVYGGTGSRGQPIGFPNKNFSVEETIFGGIDGTRKEICNNNLLYQ